MNTRRNLAVGALALCFGHPLAPLGASAEGASDTLPEGELRLVHGPAPTVAEPLPILSEGGGGHYYYFATLSADRTQVAFVMQEEGTNCIFTTSIGERGPQSSGYSNCGFPGGDSCPSFSPEGDRLYFTSGRETPDGQGLTASRVWFAERDSSGAWAENPTLLDVPGSEGGVHSLSVTNDGDFWFERGDASLYGTGSMLRSRALDDRRAAPEEVRVLPGPGGGGSPAVAPDGSYIVFVAASARGDQGEDLYAVFRSEDGSWSDPVALGDAVNSEWDESYPRISADGELLIFCRLVPEPYVAYSEYYQLHWVSSESVAALKPPGRQR